MFLSFVDMIPEMLDQYMVIVHKNTTHFTSVLMHVGTVDKHKLLLYPFQSLFVKYDAHVESQSSYMYQIYDWTFNNIFCFAHCGFCI